MRFEGEEVVVVANGAGWVGAATSLNLLRVFSEGGLQTDFHDTGRGPQVSSMIDIYGFTIASINESGCVFANPCKGEKNMSVLMYRPF